MIFDQKKLLHTNYIRTEFHFCMKYSYLDTRE